MPGIPVVPVVPGVLQAHYADYGGTDRWDRRDHHDRLAMEDEVGEHRSHWSHRRVPPLQHRIRWSNTGTTGPTEKWSRPRLSSRTLDPFHVRRRGTSSRRNSSEGDDMASTTRRSRDIPGTYTHVRPAPADGCEESLYYRGIFLSARDLFPIDVSGATRGGLGAWAVL
jgi:hypothetical protein